MDLFVPEHQVNHTYERKMSQDTTIDESLYSRQLYVLGEDAMKKMNASSALIIGMKGLGVEIGRGRAGKIPDSEEHQSGRSEDGRHLR